jgi:hypothetical protein
MLELLYLWQNMPEGASCQLMYLGVDLQYESTVYAEFPILRRLFLLKLIV